MAASDSRISHASPAASALTWALEIVGTALKSKEARLLPGSRGDIRRLAHGGSDGVALSAVQRPEAGARRRRTQASDAEARPDRAGLAAVLRIRMEAPRADANVHKSCGKPC